MSDRLVRFPGQSWHEIEALPQPRRWTVQRTVFHLLERDHRLESRGQGVYEVQVSMATSGGHVDQPNEDFVGAVPGAVVLLDGAGIPGTDSICSHGVAWYTHRLGGALLGRLSRDDGRDLGAILATAIEEIAADHCNSCDITNPGSPQATAVMVRAHAGHLNYLLLGDSFLVIDQVSGSPEVITDEREVTTRRICLAPLDGIVLGTAEYDRVRGSCIEALRARRNQPAATGSPRMIHTRRRKQLSVAARFTTWTDLRC